MYAAYFILTTTVFLNIVNHAIVQNCTKLWKKENKNNKWNNKWGKNSFERNASLTVNRKIHTLPVSRGLVCLHVQLIKFGCAWFAPAGSCAPVERWLRLYVKRHAVIREMVICLRLLPDAIRAQICAFMTFWSVTAPICLGEWWLYPLTNLGAFASWFVVAIKPIKRSAKNIHFPTESGQTLLILFFEQAVWIVFFTARSITQLPHTHTRLHRQCVISWCLAGSQHWCDRTC